MKLKPQDRAWIVERLSQQERAQLLSTVRPPEPGAASMQVTASEERASQVDSKSIDVVRSLSRVEARRVAAVLKHEPTWLVAVIVSAQQQGWSKELLDALPAAQRTDVERMQLKPMHFGPALVECATRLILTRCHNGNVPVDSAFDRLVERLSSARSRKRLTLHL
jgi:flagellar motor switch protein FliG